MKKFNTTFNFQLQPNPSKNEGVSKERITHVYRKITTI